jgi:hypothetical protein
MACTALPVPLPVPPGTVTLSGSDRHRDRRDGHGHGDGDFGSESSDSPTEAATHCAGFMHVRWQLEAVPLTEPERHRDAPGP